MSENCKEWKIKNVGEHRGFETGAKRDSKNGKGRYELLPPMVMHHLAIHFQKGAEKYESRNWEKGIPLGEYADSAMRNLIEYIMGLEDENHLIAAVWNLVCMYETKVRIDRGLLPKSLDDLPYPYKEKSGMELEGHMRGE